MHFEDYLEYLAQDDETKVILGYIEGLREGRRFFELAREITKKKPIVIMKAGRTEAGARAATSHTAALAGSDVVCEAAFKQAGVIRVEDVSEARAGVAAGRAGAGAFLVGVGELVTLAGALGLLQRRAAPARDIDATLRARVESLVRLRQEARQARDFAEADRLRGELERLGVVLEDGRAGSTWRLRE